MKKVLLFSVLLVAGLVGSQALPPLMEPIADEYAFTVRVLAMTCLAFIMIRVGYEFDIDRSNLRQYGWDYVVAATAAAFPWIFCCLYFVLVMLPRATWGSVDVWRESLLASRFAAPTSAGVLFSMLAAAGLATTWLFHKARVLAIFDDLDTVLLMIPLTMLMVGARWQLGMVVLIMAAQVWIAWKFLHRVRLPASWPWVLGYAAAITGAVELVSYLSHTLDSDVPVHIEVLLPAFVLGTIMARPAGLKPGAHGRGEAPPEHVTGPESPMERRIATAISALFMALVGLSMPAFIGAEPTETAGAEPGAGSALTRLTPEMGWGMIAVHVLAITVLSNLGKMFPALCYRKEASRRERLALAIGMWPRGEVGAGVLVVSMSYGIGGPVVAVAMLSLALNLTLTGAFILIIRRMVTAGLARVAPEPGAG